MTQDNLIKVVFVVFLILLLFAFWPFAGQAQEIELFYLPLVGIPATYPTSGTTCTVDYDEWGGYLEYCKTCNEHGCIGCTYIYDSYQDLIYYECNGIELLPHAEGE